MGLLWGNDGHLIIIVACSVRIDRIKDGIAIRVFEAVQVVLNI